MRAEGEDGLHISGAEGLYSEEEAQRAARLYLRRARTHSRGPSARITVTVEVVRRAPVDVTSLPVTTLDSASVGAAHEAVAALLRASGVRDRAIARGLRIVLGRGVMRGAALLDARTGGRLDGGDERGVRATLMGIAPGARAALGRALARRGINTERVREALVLATKVAGGPGVVAEVCVSDNPEYTTGYVASPRFGYVRVPCIKAGGDMRGGRVFFVDPGADPGVLIAFLEEIPVLVARVGRVGGVVGIADVLGGKGPLKAQVWRQGARRVPRGSGRG
jgi:6-carboxyhexanoate--CoA ligase